MQNVLSYNLLCCQCSLIPFLSPFHRVWSRATADICQDHCKLLSGREMLHRHVITKTAVANWSCSYSADKEHSGDFFFSRSFRRATHELGNAKREPKRKGAVFIQPLVSSRSTSLADGWCSSSAHSSMNLYL